jgi:hypothetical protein
MADNSAKSGNHKRLVDGGVITEDADLSPEEDHVLENLSDPEVTTLIGIRKKLDETAASKATLSDEPFSPSSNIIV